jgi:hypothetical protein
MIYLLVLVQRSSKGRDPPGKGFNLRCASDWALPVEWPDRWLVELGRM